MQNSDSSRGCLEGSLYENAVCTLDTWGELLHDLTPIINIIWVYCE